MYNIVFAAKGADLMAKRRSNGEGGLRKRKDGPWESRYTAGIDVVPGKQISKKLGKTQLEIKDKRKLQRSWEVF